MKTIQDEILQQIVDLEESSVKLKFLGFRASWMIFNCANKATAQWLMDKVGFLTPWNGTKLKVVEEKGFL